MRGPPLSYDDDEIADTSESEEEEEKEEEEEEGQLHLSLGRQ